MIKCLLKKALACVVFVCLMVHVSAQDEGVLVKQAKDLDLKFDEAGALEKYKQLVAMDSANTSFAVRCIELFCSIGGRQKDKKVQSAYYDSAADYAAKAYRINPSNSDACYAVALADFKKATLENDNKKLADYIKQIKTYADASLAANSNNAKADYLLGKWHFNLITQQWLKKPGVKTFYNNIPDTQIDSAIYYMEKSRVADMYFVQDYFDLAKAYQYDNQPAKAIDVLSRLVKLPTRNFDDMNIKEQAKQLLASLQ